MIEIWHEIKNINYFIIVFQCILFSCFLLSIKGEKRKSNIFLAIFFIVIGLTSFSGIFSHFLILNNIIYKHIPQLFYFSFPFQYLSFPFLYLYIIALTKKRFYLKSTDLIHFALFIFFIIRICIQLLTNTSDSIRGLLTHNLIFNSIEARLYYFIEYIQFIFYAIASLYILKKYRTEIKNLYSSIEEINLSWLDFVLWGFITWKFLRTLGHIIRFNTGDNYLIILIYIIAQTIFIIFLGIIVIKALKQPILFFGINENYNKQKYERNILPDYIKDEYKKKMLDYMDNKKPYLDSSLNLKKLAELINIPSYHISQILNTCLNSNFYDFINQYRINESKNILIETSSRDKSILEILYDTGFNSKSVFNSAFKKHTGITPSEFRNSKDLN